MKTRDVFINCPFSEDYKEFFLAIVYVVVRSGFKPRCALETDDGSQNRFEKICQIIAECKYGIHDISKTDLDAASDLPRFNMPLELGLFLGAKRFGASQQTRKRCIVFDREKYRYQKFISDISGQDIHSHKNHPSTLIVEIASWLRAEAPQQNIPGGAGIAKEFKEFRRALLEHGEAKEIGEDKMTFSDVLVFAVAWVEAQFA